MRQRLRIPVVTIFVSLITLALILSLPLTPTSGTEFECNPGLCRTHPVYQSILEMEFGCIFDCLHTGNVQTNTLESAALSHGTPSTPTARGTASLSITLNNPGAATEITSFSFATHPAASNGSTYPIEVYQCPYPSSCEALPSLPMAGHSVTSFNTTSTELHLGANIIWGQAYDYPISFANGQSISGTLVAQ